MTRSPDIRVRHYEISEPPLISEAIADHAKWPGLRFRLSFSAEGSAAGWQICDRRLMHWPAEDERRPGVQGLRRSTMPDPEPVWDTPPVAITVNLLRKLPLGAIEREIRRAIREDSQAMAEHMPDGRRFRKMTAEYAAEPRPGPRGRPDAFYAGIAARYLEFLDSGKPVAALAEDLHYTPSQIRNLLYEARRRKLLTSFGRGRQGGLLTDKGLRALTGGSGNGER